MRNSLIAILIFLVGATSAMAQDYRHHMKNGQKDYKKEDYKEAAEQYRQAEILKPGEPDAAFNYGAALYKSEDVDQAAEKFSQTAGGFPAQDRVPVFDGNQWRMPFFPVKTWKYDTFYTLIEFFDQSVYCWYFRCHHIARHDEEPGDIIAQTLHTGFYRTEHPVTVLFIFGYF